MLTWENAGSYLRFFTVSYHASMVLLYFFPKLYSKLDYFVKLSSFSVFKQIQAKHKTSHKLTFSSKHLPSVSPAPVSSDFIFRVLAYIERRLSFVHDAILLPV